MTEIEKTKKANGKDEDWAIIPFDEAEDDERWAKLISETEELEKKVASHEAVFGAILMGEDKLKQNSLNLLKYVWTKAGVRQSVPKGALSNRMEFARTISKALRSNSV